MKKKWMGLTAFAMVASLLLGGGMTASATEVTEEGKHRYYFDENEYVEKGSLIKESANKLSTSPKKKQFAKLVQESSLEKPETFNICVYDEFRGKPGDYVHGDKVVQFIEKYKFTNAEMGGKNTLKIVELDNIPHRIFRFEDPTPIMYTCDIMNASIAFQPVGSKSKITVQPIEQFLEQTEEADFPMVFSAGNWAEDAREQTKIANYSAHFNRRDRFLIVGQLYQAWPGKYANSFARGPEVDLMVANYSERIGDETFAGTSFASPVITGVMSNLMYAGFTRQEAVSLLGHDYSFEDATHTYRVFSEEKTYQNAIDALMEKDPVLMMKYQWADKSPAEKMQYAVKRMHKKFLE